jgi:hypothetical protein
MSMDQLPQELLVELIGYLAGERNPPGDRNTLRALGQCTRTLWQLATPVLYSTFGHFQYSGRSHLLFLRTILSRPDLAKHVRSLTPYSPFDDLSYNFEVAKNENADNFSRDSEVWKELDSLVRSIGPDRQDVLNVWIRHAEMFRYGVSTLLLLLLLPNLENLHLEYFDQRDAWLITLYLCPKAREIREFNFLQGGLRCDCLKLPIAAIPLMQVILGTEDSEVDASTRFKSWEQVALRVKSLTLEDMEIRVGNMDFYYSYLLSAFPCLTRLELGWNDPVEAWTPNATHIVESLSHLNDSLEELIIQFYFDIYNDEDEGGELYPWRWSTLTFLQKLVCLEVPSCFLFGHDRRAHCKLPQALQTLRIHQYNTTDLAGLQDLLQSTHHLRTITLYFDKLPARDDQSFEQERKIWRNGFEVRIADYDMLQIIEMLCIGSQTKLQVEKGRDAPPPMSSMPGPGTQCSCRDCR